ncbi:MAG: AMP-binding protein, partial [Pseudomonadota bacterium]
METFPSLLQQHATQRSNNVALRMKRYGIWNSYTWADVSSEVQKLACGFAATGLKPGDKVAVIGNNNKPSNPYYG